MMIMDDPPSRDKPVSPNDRATLPWPHDYLLFSACLQQSQYKFAALSSAASASALSSANCYYLLFDLGHIIFCLGKECSRIAAWSLELTLANGFDLLFDLALLFLWGNK
jgi:hypothetical protein